MTTIYDHTVVDIHGKELSLSAFRNQVLLIVNTASRCGFTPQYAALERLYRERHPRGFSIIGFPCNQFGAQEPGTNGEVQEFCSANYGVTFPMMQKIDVNGEKAAPIYKFLRHAAPGILGTESIKWNFTKFLISRDGQTIERFAPLTKPEKLSKQLDKLLESKVPESVEKAPLESPHASR